MKLQTFITIRRIDEQTIEYDVVEGSTYLLTSEHPLWRADDQEMIAAFKAEFPDADISL